MSAANNKAIALMLEALLDRVIALERRTERLTERAEALEGIITAMVVRK